MNGPYRLGDSFIVTLAGSLRLVPSSQTLEPMANGECQGHSVIQDSCALCCASWAVFLASSMAESRSCMEGMSVFWLVGVLAGYIL